MANYMIWLYEKMDFKVWERGVVGVQLKIYKLENLPQSRRILE